MKFPENKRFAFSIVDDTDLATRANVSPVYECLENCGLRTTKTVWAVAPTEAVGIGGATLDEPEYLDFILRLKTKGFEVASHGATSHGLPREGIIRALELFRARVGCYPTLHCNHYTNRDSLYWGAARFSSPIHRCVYRFVNLGKPRCFEGHVLASRFFWGDLARGHFRYVRNFVFDEINLCRARGNVLYHDPDRPWVNFWFTSTRAPDRTSFLRTLSEDNCARLEVERGVCILYTHFGSGFVENGVLDPEVRGRIEQLSRRPGWFVPASELLDYLRTEGFHRSFSRRERAAMERNWLCNRIASRLARCRVRRH